MTDSPTFLTASFTFSLLYIRKSQHYSLVGFRVHLSSDRMQLTLRNSLLKLLREVKCYSNFETVRYCLNLQLYLTIVTKLKLKIICFNIFSKKRNQRLWWSCSKLIFVHEVIIRSLSTIVQAHSYQCSFSDVSYNLLHP